MGKELYIWPFEGNHKADMAPPHENEFDTPAIWESFWFSFDKANYYLSLRTCDSRCDIELGKGQQSPFHKNFVLLMVALIIYVGHKSLYRNNCKCSMAKGMFCQAEPPDCLQQSPARYLTKCRFPLLLLNSK